jgi:hypothetical protein
MAAEPANPLRPAFDARDPALLEGVLAEDVILRSPIFSVPFSGRDECTRLFETLFEVLGELDYVLEEGGDPAVFAWRTEVEGEPLEGVDMLRRNERGEITEITVFMRPLRGIAAFANATGPRLAREISPARGLLARAAAGPPALMMRAVAAIGPRMLGLRRSG